MLPTKYDVVNGRFSYKLDIPNAQAISAGTYVCSADNGIEQNTDKSTIVFSGRYTFKVFYSYF